MRPQFWSASAANWDKLRSQPSQSLAPPPAYTPTATATAAGSPSGVSTASLHFAQLANLASQTISSRLSSAFLEAFTTTTPVSSDARPMSSQLTPAYWSSHAATSTSRALDTDKILSVLSGQSRIEIVPVVPSSKTATDAAALQKAFDGLSLGVAKASQPPKQQVGEHPMSPCSLFKKAFSTLGCKC